MLKESEKMMEEIDEILENMTTGKDPVIICGFKNQTPFIISNIAKAELRHEVLTHFSNRELEITKQESI